MNIDEEINNLILTVRKEFKVPAYTYNQHDKFIGGITPIYYSGAYFDDKELTEAIKSLLVGKWMSAGEKVREFERGFSRKINQTHSVMLNTGSSANLVMISALKKYFEWDDEDEIIVSAVGFPTTISVIYQNRLKPVFVDIEFKTLNFDLDLIEEKITSKTRAIFVSPVLGNISDMDRIVDICAKHNLELILDGCDSLGTKWKGKYLQEYAVASSCSFYAAHHISTFEGGMISSNNGKIIQIARKMVNWGRDCVCNGVENLLPDGICNHRFDRWLKDYNYNGIIDHKYFFTEIGFNLKPLEMCGAVGLVQLEKMEEIFRKRKVSYHSIRLLFRKYIPDLVMPEVSIYLDYVPFGTPFICKDRNQKETLVHYLEKNKIQTRNYFAGNLLSQPAYAFMGDYKDYPNSNEVLSRVFFIGASPHYNDDVFQYIERVLREYKDE